MSSTIVNSSILPVYDRVEIDFTSGKGSFLFDKQGNDYLDFISGLGANILGHSDIGLSSILANARILHLSNLYTITPYKEYAELLTSVSPFDHVFACNSGAESVECALKTMLHYSLSIKKYIQNPEIISFVNSFHGRSILSSSISQHGRIIDLYKKIFSGAKFVEIDDFDEFKDAVNNNTVGVILEPILGHGGIKHFSKVFLQRVRELCYEQDIPLCFDCIQCGMGRTGSLFRFKEINVEPDICLIGKGMAGGLPVGACLSKKKYSFAIANIKDHGSTFGGNPLVMSAAKYVLERLIDSSENSIMNNVIKSSEILRFALEALKSKYSRLISDVRVYGLMIGIELIDIDAYLVSKNLARNYRFLTSGLSGGVLRMLPSFTVNAEEIQRATSILDAFFSEINNERK